MSKKQQQTVEQIVPVSFDFLDADGKQVAGKEIPFEHLMLTKGLLEGDKKMKASLKYHHFEIINMVMEMFDRINMPVVLDPILLAKSDSKYHDNMYTRRDIEEGRGNIYGWIFNRLVARFHSQIGGELYNPSIGVGYNTDGLTFCYGTNVKVCGNMCILGGTRISTYGNDGVSVEKALNILQMYIKEQEERFEKDIILFNRMKDIQIDGRAGMAELIGEMCLAMNFKNGIDIKQMAPLNSGELNNFTTSYLRNYARDFDQRMDAPLFDVYQLGTQILTHSVQNIHNKFQDLEDFGTFFTNRFELN